MTTKRWCVYMHVDVNCSSGTTCTCIITELKHNSMIMAVDSTY